MELELEHKDLSFDGKTWFLKVHIPWKTELRYSAVMNLKYPVKRFIPISVKAWVRRQGSSRVFSGVIRVFFRCRGTKRGRRSTRISSSTGGTMRSIFLSIITVLSMKNRLFTWLLKATGRNSGCLRTYLLVYL